MPHSSGIKVYENPGKRDLVMCTQSPYQKPEAGFMILGIEKSNQLTPITATCLSYFAIPVGPLPMAVS